MTEAKKKKQGGGIIKLSPNYPGTCPDFSSKEVMMGKDKEITVQLGSSHLETLP